jgi:hypothetical protein
VYGWLWIHWDDDIDDTEEIRRRVNSTRVEETSELVDEWIGREYGIPYLSNFSAQAISGKGNKAGDG